MLGESTMSESVTVMIKQAKKSWLTWNEINIHQRIGITAQWGERLKDNPNIGDTPAHVIEFHNRQAVSLIAESQMMPGPTGESNILSTSGRGIFLMMMEQDSSVPALVGLLNCALIAGNSVLLLSNSNNKEIVASLQQACSLSGVEMPVFIVNEKEALQAIISDPNIAGVGYVGNEAQAISLNQALAARTGQIAQLIAETDLALLPTVRDQHLVLRFITEKTLSTNVTAVGGNATLLALGCGEQ